MISGLGLLVFGAMVAVAGLVVLLFPLFRRYALARPNARSLHSVPTPQGGGAAVIIVAVIAAAIGLYCLGGGSLTARPDIVSVLAGAWLIAAVGMYDDIRPIPVVPRLALQLFVTAMVVLSLPADVRLVSALPLWIERVVLILSLAWFVNLVNFMDGMDLMSVVEATGVLGGLATMWVIGVLPDFAGVVTAALLGAMWGFAWFNRPPARLFLGDVGSLPLGLVVGWLLIVLAGKGHLAAALILPLYYLVDATVTLLRRVVGGEQWWVAHRTHFYQKAHANGMTTRRVVGRVGVLNMGLVIFALISALSASVIVDLVASAMALLLVALTLLCFARPVRSAHGVSAK
jgi:UDP-N-acetylmuramyl pentapeptide phosphotransferase/UDP-N-acetylglucosamine-1-phosphate transferase